MPLRISGLQEHDIDLLLLEEILCSEAFWRGLVSCAFGEAVAPTGLVDASNSVNAANGESDLELWFRCREGVGCILIENKIDATFQPGQAARYRERGDNYMAQRRCQAFRTLLIAPQVYIGVPADTMGFDAAVPYERVLEWIVESPDLRSRRRYKRALLQGAIEKATLGYNPIADAPVTDFWQTYWRHAAMVAPSLQMNFPKSKPSRAGFVYFRPSPLPKGVAIVHKLPHGNVDLQFQGWGPRIDVFAQLVAPHIEADMVSARAHGSSVVRLSVSAINAASQFVPQEGAVRAGLEAATRLLHWYLGRGETFSRQLLSSR